MRIVLAVGLLALIIVAGVGTYEHVSADHAAERSALAVIAAVKAECSMREGIWHGDTFECSDVPRCAHVGAYCADGNVDPYLDLPLSNPRSFKVSCSGSTATDTRIPFDGGGPAIQTETVFVSNHNATCVRVSGTDVTASNGVEIGTGAACIDGPNVNMEARLVDCFSEGSAQFVDVTLGRR